MNVETQKNVTVVTEKSMNIKKLLNIVGIFIFLGMALSVVTNPVDINENMNLYVNEELKMNSEKTNEFLLFILGSTLIYYFLVNVYFAGNIGRKLFYLAMVMILGGSLYMVYYLINHPIAH